MAYVDGFVIPVPKDKLEAYKAQATLCAQVWKEHGALEYRVHDIAALQRRVQHAFLHPQHFGRQRVDALRDGVAMERTGAKHAKNEKHQRAGRHLIFRHRLHRGSIQMPAPQVKDR